MFQTKTVGLMQLIRETQNMPTSMPFNAIYQ